MGDMNYIGAIVKLLETPKPKFINSTTFVIKIRVQLSQVRKIRTVRLVIWGNLAREVINYYKINDYILVEGYVSVRDTSNSQKNRKSLKKVTITALRIYPFLLNYNPSIKKLS